MPERRRVAASVLAIACWLAGSRSQAGQTPARPEVSDEVPLKPPVALPIQANAVNVAPGPSSGADTPHPKTGWWMAGAAHASFLGDLIDRSSLLIRFGFAFSGGYRLGPWGVFIRVEEDFWTETEVDLAVRHGALNIGSGLDFLYWDDRVRASVAMGPSVLVAKTAFNNAGHMGIFVDVRPTGLRFTAGDWAVQIDPLTFTVEAPVLETPSLVEIQYRTAVLMEYDL